MAEAEGEPGSVEVSPSICGAPVTCQVFCLQLGYRKTLRQGGYSGGVRAGWKRRGRNEYPRNRAPERCEKEAVRPERSRRASRRGREGRCEASGIPLLWTLCSPSPRTAFCCSRAGPVCPLCGLPAAARSGCAPGPRPRPAGVGTA